jgi:hypothetical protein
VIHSAYDNDIYSITTEWSFADLLKCF